MAVALEGFSIREYALKMRSVDLERCWPFGGEGKKGRSLPPMSFRKFRWWSDEVPAARSAGSEAERDGDGDAGPGGHAESTAEIPSSRGSGKSKQRAPKKRSIVELFAVAPPIETVDVEMDGDDEEDDEEGERVEEKNGKEAGDAKKETGKKKKSSKGKIGKKKKKKKKLKVEIRGAKKEKILNPKVPSSVHVLHKFQDSVHKKWSGKSSKNSVDSQKKPMCKKNLPKKRSFKRLQTSKLISKNQSEAGKVFPTHSILKNPTKIAVKKASAKTTKRGGNLISFCCEAVKHVTFSGKDDILGPNKSCSSVEHPQLQSLCKILSDALVASSAVDKSHKGDKLTSATEGAQVEVLCNTNVSTSAVETRIGSLSEKQQLGDSHGHVNQPTYTNPSMQNCPITEKNVQSISVDLNHDMQSFPDLNCLHAGASTLPYSDRRSGDPRVVDSIHSEELNSRSDLARERFPMVSDIRFFPMPIRTCVSRSDAMDSLTILKSPSSPNSTSCLVVSMEENGGQRQQPADPKMDYCRWIQEFQPTRNPSSKELMGSMCSYVGPRRTSHSVPSFKDKCISQDFVGLPLNSQGEFIQLHSGNKFGFTETCKKQNAGQGSIHNFRVPNYVEPMSNVDHMKMMKGKFSCLSPNQEEPLNWFQEQYCPVSRSLPSGFGFSNLQGFARLEIQNDETRKDKDQFFHQGPIPVKVSCHGCREDNHTHNYLNRAKFQLGGSLDHACQPVSQQTMRLMGKNVTVGKSNEERHGFDDGGIWTDKEVIIDNCPSARVSDKPLPKQWLQQEQVGNPASGTLKDNRFHPLEASISFYHAPVPEPRSEHTHFDYRSQWMPRNVVSSTSGNHALKVNLFSQPLPTPSLLNMTSKCTINSNPGPLSVKTGHQLPVVTSNPPDIYQHMLLSSTHCKHSQGVAYSTSSTFHPPHQPFLYQNLGSSQPLLSHSSPNLPQWLLNAKHKKSQESSFYSDPVAANQPCSLPGPNFFRVTSPNCTSMLPFPVGPTKTSQRYGSSTPTSSQPSFIPECATSKSISAVDNVNKHKIREGTNLKVTYLKALDNAGKTRKRPAAKDDGFLKPAKKTCLKMQEEFHASRAKEREQMAKCAQYNEKSTDVDLPVMLGEKEGFRTLTGSNSLKFDGGSRTGPIKLSAGAKHILRPSQHLDQDSRPIHSTIPFSFGNNSDKATVLQKKATKVYRF